MTYPGDVNEYDRVVEGSLIPEGQVQLVGFWGPPDGYELLVFERDYLKVLAAALDEAEYPNEANRLRAVIKKNLK